MWFDLVAPIGKGQRSIIVAPPKASVKQCYYKTLLNPLCVTTLEVFLIVFLIDERPEEVTEMERTVRW